MKLSEMSMSKAILCFWGLGKAGKTVLASQFPGAHFACAKEDGLQSVKTLRAEMGLNFDLDAIIIDDTPTKDPDFIKMSSPQFANLSGWQKYVKLVQEWCKVLTENDFLVLDHWTNIVNLLEHHIEKKSGHVMYLQDWQIWLDEIDTLLGTLKQTSTKCSSIIIAHEEHLKDDISGNINRFILTPTKLRFSFASYPTEFLYLKTAVTGNSTTKKVQRVLQALPDQSTNTGGYSNMPDIIDPTYEKMKPYLERALGRELPAPLWTPEAK